MNRTRRFCGMLAAAHLAALLAWAFRTPETPSPVKSDEKVILFPTFASRAADGSWSLEIHGWIYEPEHWQYSLTWLAQMLDLKVIPPEAHETFAKRGAWFLVDNESNKTVPVQIGRGVFTCPPSAENGRFRCTVRLGPEELVAGRPETMRAVLPAGDQRRFEGKIYALAPRGWCVVSDIDDTLKVTGVYDRADWLQNTFTRPFEPIDGMADLFQHWRFTHAPQFFYVSASPWQLYAALSEFFAEAGLPEGVFALRDFRWKDQTLVDFFGSPAPHKVGVLLELLERLPERRFVLIGDDSEADPEVFGELARRFPDQIVRVFIRVPAPRAGERERFDAAFRGISADRWRAFADPREICEALP